MHDSRSRYISKRPAGTIVTRRVSHEIARVLKIAASWVAMACGILVLNPGLHAADEKGSEKAFLAHYEAVRAALAADNLAGAHDAAALISGDQTAQQLAQAPSLTEARDLFRVLSKKAVELADAQGGLYVAHCPMYKGGADWVQTSDRVENPYFGKRMLTCGEIRETK